MKILSLTTAEQGAGLALFDNGKLICDAYWASPKTHSRRLVAMIGYMVEGQAGMSIHDMDGFIAARGPGSFTGLRIGIGVVKGLALGTRKPAAGVSSLDGIGYRFAHSRRPVCAMMDAKRGEVYTAVYRFSDGELSGKSTERACPPEAAVGQAGEGALFVGSGARAYQEKILELTQGEALFGPPDMSAVSAAALARPALFNPAFFQNGENRLTPAYLRKSDAEMMAAAKETC